VAAPGASLTTRTTTHLLDALREPGNERTWEELDTRYRPIIASLARRIGLGSSEAEDVAQHTLAEFVRVYREGRYEREKGRLSSWILGIARNTALTALRERAGRGGTPFDGAVAHVGEDSLRAIWEEEREREIVARALDLLRNDSSIEDRTLRAFELVALRGVPAGEVGVQCGMSTDQVYVARSRVTRRLRGMVRQLTDAYEADR